MKIMNKREIIITEEMKLKDEAKLLTKDTSKKDKEEVKEETQILATAEETG